MMTVGEVDVGFLEDGCPLEGSPMKSLAGGTMAELRAEGFLAGDLVLDSAAVTSALVQCFEAVVLVMDFVWFSELPFVLFALEILGMAAV